MAMAQWAQWLNQEREDRLRRSLVTKYPEAKATLIAVEKGEIQVSKNQELRSPNTPPVKNVVIRVIPWKKFQYYSQVVHWVENMDPEEQ